MNSDKFPQLQDRAASSLVDKFAAMKEHAEHVIAEKVEQMKANGEAHELTDDEERMLLAYKAFNARSKPGSVFSWRTPKTAGIVLPTTTSLIHDPQQVSARPYGGGPPVSPPKNTHPNFAALLLPLLIVACFAADASACNRCGLFGRRCRFSSHIQHVAYAPPSTSTNIIFNNLYPASPYLLAQGGQSIYGVQSAAGAYGDSPALFMDRAARFTELALQQSGDATAAFNETGRLALELNDAADRRAKNTALALSAMEANREPSSQVLQIQIQDGVMSIVQPPAAQPLEAPAIITAATCAKCHTGEKPPKGIVLDGSQPFDLEAAMTAVISGKMPPKLSVPLTPQEKAAVTAGLFRLQSGDLQ